MTRSAAAKTAQAADALLDWLRPKFFPAAPALPETELLVGAERAGPATDPATAGPAMLRDGAAPIDVEISAPALPPTLKSDVPDAHAKKMRAEAAEKTLALPNTDWLHHRLSVTGPAEAVAAFEKKAAGAGTIPWHLDLDRLQEDFFHFLVSPPAPHRRTLSFRGARVLSENLREAVGRRHALAVARVGRSTDCPFDLHALLPVPEFFLQLGPDDPDALAWLWQYWGTTQALRHVTADAAAAKNRPADQAVFGVQFWSADWTPWRALATLTNTWPALRFEARPTYFSP